MEAELSVVEVEQEASVLARLCLSLLELLIPLRSEPEEQGLLVVQIQGLIRQQLAATTPYLARLLQPEAAEQARTTGLITLVLLVKMEDQAVALR